MQPRFSIGDNVWIASYDRHERKIPCPDCGGTGQITVIFNSGEQYSVECGNCRRGYEPSTGKITTYDYEPLVESISITGMEILPSAVRYHSGTHSAYRVFDEDKVFSTEVLALQAAKELQKAYIQQEHERISRKEKDTKSWAWNASYHKKCIQRAEKEIAYHKAKLSIAKIKVKD